jgi:hypothetical protein
MLRLLLAPFLTGIAIVFVGLVLASAAYVQLDDEDEAGSGNDVSPSSQMPLTQAFPPSASPVATSASVIIPLPTLTATPMPAPTIAPTVEAVAPVGPVAPGPPAGLTATYDPQAGVLLSWQAVAGSYYNIYRSELPGGGPGVTYLALGSSAAPQIIDNTAQPGRRYYYVVTAVRAGLQSAPSNEASVLTAGLAAPTASPPTPTGVP